MSYLRSGVTNSTCPHCWCISMGEAGPLLQGSSTPGLWTGSVPWPVRNWAPETVRFCTHISLPLQVGLFFPHRGHFSFGHNETGMQGRGRLVHSCMHHWGKAPPMHAWEKALPMRTWEKASLHVCLRKSSFLHTPENPPPNVCPRKSPGSSTWS